MSDAHYYYDNPLENKDQYLNDIQQSLAWNINPISKRDILNDKIAFEKHFNQYIATPKTLGLITNGQIRPDSQVVKNSDDLKNYLINKGAVVIKAQSGAGGYGIFVVKYAEDSFYFNDKAVDFNKIMDTVSDLDDYFISEYLYQSDFNNELFDKTVNTIRILTMIDPQTKKAFIPVAVQRIGTEQSIPTDNWQQGAMSVKVNLDTGELENAVYFQKSKKAKKITHHSDTGTQITGKVIPQWDEIKQSVLEAADQNNFLHYIGWDVVLTNNGIKVLEANNGSGVIIYQVHGPILTDERVKRFYKDHNII